MLSQKDLETLVSTEEKRLGVGSREFMERHNEIMELIDKSCNGMKDVSTGTVNTDRSECPVNSANLRCAGIIICCLPVEDRNIG